MKPIDGHIREFIDGCTAADAVGLLCEEFDKGHSSVTFLRSGARRELRSLLTAAYLGDLSADDLGPIEFFGGPPGKRQYHKGTLMTMLCDSVLFQFYSNGYYAEMVQGKLNDAKTNETRLPTTRIPF